jgi:hypothetical protein
VCGDLSGTNKITNRGSIGGILVGCMPLLALSPANLE